MAMGLRALSGAVSAFAFLAMLTTAQAAPKVSGKYAMMSWSICQTAVHVTKSTATRVTGTISVPGIGGIFKSTKQVVAAVTPQTENFLKQGGGSGPAITSLPQTPGTVIQDVGATSTVNFLTVVNTATVPVMTGISPNWSAGNNSAGLMNMNVGVLTFPATPVSSGNVSITQVIVSGHSYRDDNPANNVPIKRQAKTTTGTFTLTDTTLSAGGNVFDIAAADIDNNGVAHSIYAVQRPKTDEYCINSTSLTKQ